MFFTRGTTFSHKVVLVNLSPRCHGKHNTNRLSSKTFNSSRRLFNLISNARAYVLCNMFACLFFFNTASSRWRLLVSGQCFSYQVQGAVLWFKKKEKKGGGHFILKL